MEILLSKRFEKAYDKLGEPEKAKIDEALTLFIEDRTAPLLRDHPLKGKLKKFRSFSAAWDLRIIYQEKDEFVTISLINVGSHNKVY
jgi:mRNA interferase YafQ